MIKRNTMLITALLVGCAGAEPELETSTEAIHGARALDGCYVPTAGGVRALGYSPVDALGTFRIVAERQGWRQLDRSERRRTKRWFVAHGSLKGVSDPATGFAAHVEVAHDRGGILFTDRDTFVPTVLGCRPEGEQTLNYVAGTGTFSNLRAGSHVTMVGAINQCPNDPDFGHVDFDVIRGQGEICFTSGT